MVSVKRSEYLAPKGHRAARIGDFSGQKATFSVERYESRDRTWIGTRVLAYGYVKSPGLAEYRFVPSRLRKLSRKRVGRRKDEIAEIEARFNQLVRETWNSVFSRDERLEMKTLAYEVKQEARRTGVGDAIERLAED